MSQGDLPDRLVVQATLSNYSDENGNTLDPGLIRTKDIPRQIASQAEAETMETTGASAFTAISSSSVFQLGMTFGMQTGLNSLWSMINSQ